MAPKSPPPRVGVVVVGHGPEPLLADCLASVRASVDVDVDLVVVDNGIHAETRTALPPDPSIHWIRPGYNTGFTGGCNAGVAALATRVVVLLNSDAIVRPGALAALADCLDDERIGIAMGKVLLYRDPDTVNSTGNPVHYSLLAWSGGFGDPSSAHTAITDVPTASGCLLAIRRADWNAFGGFHAALFAYGEDVELSLRMWRSGRRVVLCPDAEVLHDYDFKGTAGKLALLERNRWINMLTLYDRATLLRLLPGLLVVEAGIWWVSATGGWWPLKLRGYRWLLTHRQQLRRRRRLVAGGSDAWLDHLTLTIRPDGLSQVTVPQPVNRVLAALGRAALRGPSSAARQPHDAVAARER